MSGTTAPFARQLEESMKDGTWRDKPVPAFAFWHKSEAATAMFAAINALETARDTLASVEFGDTEAVGAILSGLWSDLNNMRDDAIRAFVGDCPATDAGEAVWDAHEVRQDEAALLAIKPELAMRQWERSQ